MLLHDIDNAQRRRWQMFVMGHEWLSGSVRPDKALLFRFIGAGMTRLTWTGLCPSSER